MALFPMGHSDKYDTHSFGSLQNITTYGSSTNLFTVPSDGYVYVNSPVQQGKETKIMTSLGGTTTIIASAVCAVAQYPTAAALYVKKGLQFYISISSGSTGGVGYFLPIN